MFKKWQYFYLIFVQVLVINLCASGVEVESPNAAIRVEFSLNDDGAPVYGVSRFGAQLVNSSRLGFTIKGQPALAKNFEMVSSETKAVNEVWEQPWGEKRNIADQHNELVVKLKETTAPQRELNIVFRVFDDGVGFRYEIPKQPSLSEFDIMDELTEFALAEDYRVWWQGAYQYNRYEYLYQQTPISAVDTVHTPLTMESKNGVFLSIHEAALTDYASMTLARTDAFTLKADLVPWSDGVKVRATAPLQTPWRTIQIADTPGGLITSYLILNLNEPCKIEDTSWIKPGKYVGIWWGMHLETFSWSSGPKHGATTENTKRYIDFASKYGFSGVLVEGWNEGWDGDWINNGHLFNFTTPYPDFDIKDITDYAANKNVQLIGHNETGGAVMNYEKQLEDAFAFYEKYNVHAVKTGYVNYGRGIKRLDENGDVQGEWHHGQHMVRHYRHVVEEAAKHHIMIDAHEPIKPTGIRRTWPNMMTREGSRGQEYNAWSDDGGNPPDHTTILPFTRLLGGPMDFTPGIFDLLYEKAKPNNRVNTTLMKQLALYVVLYSPLQMAADLPENYEKRLDAFQFIVDVPCDWQDTQALNGCIGDYITVARQDRNSDDWYLGSITDEEGRFLQVPLTFLQPGVKYTAQIYRDGDNADWETNPYDYVIEEKPVDSCTTMTLRLAPGGGQAIRFHAVD